MARAARRLGAVLLVAFLGAAAAPAAGPEVAPAPRVVPTPHVTPVPRELRDRLKLDPFYQKHLDLDGLPILSSAKVSDAGLREAAFLIRKMLANRPDVLKEMVRRGCRFVVMAPTEMTTDVPEQRHLKNDPKTDWDRRARGLGGKITSCGEENLLNLRGDRYRNENILVHEFSHAVHRYGLGSLDRRFDARLQEVYRKATAAGLWKDTYAATNHSEYWAEGVQSYYDCNNPPNRGVHNDINTREKLAKYDPALFELIDESFGQNPWRYVRYDRRPKPELAPPPRLVPG
jgi:alpha-glucosidase